MGALRVDDVQRLRVERAGDRARAGELAREAHAFLVAEGDHLDRERQPLAGRDAAPPRPRSRRSRRDCRRSARRRAPCRCASRAAAPAVPAGRPRSGRPRWPAASSSTAIPASSIQPRTMRVAAAWAGVRKRRVSLPGSLVQRASSCRCAITLAPRAVAHGSSPSAAAGRCARPGPGRSRAPVAVVADAAAGTPPESRPCSGP